MITLDRSPSNVLTPNFGQAGPRIAANTIRPLGTVGRTANPVRAIQPQAKVGAQKINGNALLWGSIALTGVIAGVALNETRRMIPEVRTALEKNNNKMMAEMKTTPLGYAKDGILGLLGLAGTGGLLRTFREVHDAKVREDFKTIKGEFGTLKPKVETALNEFNTLKPNIQTALNEFNTLKPNIQTTLTKFTALEPNIQKAINDADAAKKATLPAAVTALQTDMTKAKDDIVAARKVADQTALSLLGERADNANNFVEIMTKMFAPTYKLGSDFQKRIETKTT